MGRSNRAGQKDAEPSSDQATKEITASELAAVLARVDGPTTARPPTPAPDVDEGRISGARRIIVPRVNDPAAGAIQVGRSPGSLDEAQPSALPSSDEAGEGPPALKAAPVVPAFVFRGSTPDVAPPREPANDAAPKDAPLVAPAKYGARSTWLAVALLVAAIAFAVALNLR